MIETEQDVLQELKYLLVDSRDCLCSTYSCKLLSAMFATLLLSIKNKCYIIDTHNHSVVYDGKDTWDIFLGLVFRNYRYPENNLPKPEVINQFKHWYKDNLFNEYYNTENMPKEVLIKEIKVLGVANGTKEN